MKVGVHFSCSALVGESWPDIYASALRQAEIADELGYDSALVSEHHFKAEGWVPSPFVLCGAIAARTTRIRVGTDIVILPFAHPLRVAEDILTLDNLSRGRAVLGAGMGHSAAEFERFGVPYKQRVSRTEEALAVIRAAFEQDEITVDGRYTQLAPTRVTPRPVGSPPPVWYGAISEAGARRAARSADALVIGPSLSVAEAAAARAAYDEERAALGLTGPGEVHLRREIALAPTAQEAWGVGLEPLRYQASSLYADFPRDGSAEEFRTFARDRYLVGDPAQVREQIAEARSAFAFDGLLLRFQLPGTANEAAERATALFGTDVLGSLA
ncbi:MAG TPA: LLM class flavin-dependent oxidoreductase [Cellulomonas sp.]